MERKWAGGGELHKQRAPTKKKKLSSFTAICHDHNVVMLSACMPRQGSLSEGSRFSMSHTTNTLIEGKHLGYRCTFEGNLRKARG